jgi:PAS domain S-box-containing protein
MSSRSYSFLDVAVLEAVGSRFAAADALVVLSQRLDEVLWTNGPGARLFGFSDIFSFIGADPELPLPVRRQIEATPGYPRIGRDRPIALRLANGMTSRVVGFSASSVTMPDGEDAILLAAADTAANTRTREEIAARAIEGLSGEGQFVVLVDHKGAVTAASAGFAELGIIGDTLRELADEVAGERDRLVKRLVPAAKGSLPAGMARLTGELNLLMVIDEAVEDELAEEAEAAAESAVASTAAASGSDGGEVSPEPAAATSETGQVAPAVTGETHAAPAGRGPDGDEWYFNDASGERADATSAGAAEPGLPQPPVELAGMPVRFVWRTDAQGRFSALADEFRVVFGDEAADVIGKRFADVARVFGLDPDGEISGLLERRDTWSGRSVLWPVAGTDLKVPVDLAALPVYDRNRKFEGFRGFGVARMGDAVIDPDAIGLSLRPPAPEPAEQVVPATADEALETAGMEAALREIVVEDAQPAEDPFRGEVPALQVSPGPERRQSDKVIQLAERRPNGGRQLSAAERLNFNQIGEKLRSAGLVTESSGETPTPAELAAEPQPLTNGHDTSGIAGEASGARDAGRLVEAGPEAVEPDTVIGGVPEQAEAALRTEAETVAEARAGAQDEPAGARSEPAEDAAPPADVEEPATEAAPSAETPDAKQAAEPAPAQEPAAQPAEVFLPSAFAGLAANKNLPGIDAAVLSRLPLPVLIHAGDALFYANREFLQLTGYPSLADLDQAGGLGAIFGEPYASDDTAERKLRLRTRDGQEFPVDAFLQSVAWNGGKALLLALKRSDAAEVVSIARPAATSPAAETGAGDVDARIEELRTIIDTATDGVVLIGNDGKIRSISRPAEALFGFNGFEVVGHDFASLFAIESQKAAADYLAGLAGNGVASVLNDGREVIGREAQGRFIPLFMTIGRLPQDSGFCAVVRDLTQWKRAEEELTQARAEAERTSSQKTEFLARVSHEIRTPLNAIIGFSELMLDEKFGPIGNDRYRDYLRDINKSGNHVLELVNDLLDITKIEAGQQEMSYEAVSLAEVLGEAVAMMQPQANRERVIIRSSFASRLPDVVADLRSIRQIALNLLSNAIRYTPAGGQVIVSTAYEQSGDLVMRVRDTGIGMAPGEIEQALKPFKQINALKRPRGDGTGLGLPLTKAMVEANRAKFAIHSSPGEGTLVEITFPSTRVLAH